MAEGPRALLQSRPGGGRFEIEGEATIGRASHHAVVIDDGRVSSDHARIAWDEAAGCFVLEDLDSTNGTELDGVRLRAPETLGRLHTITFAGVHHYVFRDLSAAALDTAPVTPLGAHGVGEKTAIGELPVVPPPSLGAGTSDELPGESTDAHGAPLDVPASLFARSEDAVRGADDVDTVPDHEGTLTGDERALPLPPELAARADALHVGGEPEPAVDAVAEAESGSAARGESGDSPSSPFAQIDPAARAMIGREAAGESESDGVPEPLGRPDAPSRHALEVVYEDGRIERFPLRPGSNLIGRGRDADVRIDSPHLSRRHASVRITPGAIAVRDLGSSNHTFVAGHRIETEVEIETGDTLRLGNLAARVVAESEREESDR